MAGRYHLCHLLTLWKKNIVLKIVTSQAHFGSLSLNKLQTKRHTCMQEGPVPELLLCMPLHLRATCFWVQCPFKSQQLTKNY